MAGCFPWVQERSRALFGHSAAEGAQVGMAGCFPWMQEGLHQCSLHQLLG